MVKGVDHIGIAVQNIDETLKLLKTAFGAEEVKRTEYPQLQQISSTVNLKGTYFELMQATGPDGAIGKFMQVNKMGGLHHISIMCDKLETLVDTLEKDGLKIIGKMYEGPDRVAFIHPKSAQGLLLELTDTGSRTK